MRRLLLYLRSRATGWSLVLLSGMAVVARLLAEQEMRFPRTGPRPDLTVPVLILMPLVAALIIGVSIRNPWGEVEETASYPLPWLRLAHLALLVAFSGVGLLAAASHVQLEYGELMVLRNLAGFVGYVCAAAWLFGSRLSWFLPFGYTILVGMVGQVEQGNMARWAWWAWPFRPGDDGSALLLAGMALLLCAGAVCRAGARDEDGA